MGGIGAEVGRGILVNAEDAEPLGKVAAIRLWRPLSHVFFQGLSHDIGWADAGFPVYSVNPHG